MFRSIVTVSICSAVLLAGCGAKKTEQAPVSQKKIQQSDAAANLAKQVSKSRKSAPKVPQLTGSSPTKLQVADVISGKGRVAKAGDELVMQYVGVAWSTNNEFDSSWSRGEPFTFTLGQGAVIKGWDQGLVGIKKGGRRVLVIPATLGYGPHGTPDGSIRPNEALVFVVDAVNIKRAK